MLDFKPLVIQKNCKHKGACNCLNPQLHWAGGQTILPSSSIAGLEQLNHGKHCIYINKGHNWGIKLYRSRERRNNAWFWQHEVEKVGRAPKVFEKVRVLLDDGILYGYVTEYAECDLGPDLEGFEALDLIKSEMAFFNFPFCDLKLEDIGRIEGRIVYVDFDMFGGFEE